MKAKAVENPLVGYHADGLPIFAVVAVGRFRQYGAYSVRLVDGCHLVFHCPRCKIRIAHGGTYGKPGDGDGHRCAHCACWPNGYYLREGTP